MYRFNVERDFAISLYQRVCLLLLRITIENKNVLKNFFNRFNCFYLTVKVLNVSKINDHFYLQIVTETDERKKAIRRKNRKKSEFFNLTVKYNKDSTEHDFFELKTTSFKWSKKYSLVIGSTICSLGMLTYRFCFCLFVGWSLD